MTKKFLSVACAAFLTMGISAAAAQPKMKETTTTTTTTTITTENRDKIRTYVTKQKPAKVTVKEKVMVGEPLPASVKLQAFPADVGVKNYQYVYLGDRVVLVEPKKREVVEIIELN